MFKLRCYEGYVNDYQGTAHRIQGLGLCLQGGGPQIDPGVFFAIPIEELDYGNSKGDPPPK